MAHRVTPAGAALALTAALIGGAQAQAPLRPMSAPFATNSWFENAVKACWSLPTTRPPGATYVAVVSFTLSPDGALAAPPRLLRKPPSPGWAPVAQSALRAVEKCAPYHPPSPLGIFARRMGGVTVRFDPDAASTPATPLKP